MAKYNRKICDQCRCVYSPDYENQEYCYRCLLDLKDLKIKENYYKTLYEGKKGLNKNCKNCGREFFTIKTDLHCTDTCKRNSIGKLNSQKGLKNTEQEKIEKSNKDWLEHNKKKNKVDLNFLNKKAEYKRVMDDKGWDHYLKGRKWDRI